MISPVFEGGLELRAAGDGSRRLSGKFPYKKRAVVHSGGNGRRPQKEVFESFAFKFSVEDPDRDIHLLSGHSFDKPLASKKAGTLELVDTAAALIFNAILTPEILRTTWGQDFVASYEAGLVGGISPGFRVAPPEVVPVPEETIEEDPEEGNALIRRIFAALLFEISLVTRPAYDETLVDLRSFNSQSESKPHHLKRWRL